MNIMYLQLSLLVGSLVSFGGGMILNVRDDYVGRQRIVMVSLTTVAVLVLSAITVSALLAPEFWR